MSEYYRKLLKSVEKSEQVAYKELKLVMKENEKLKKEKQELLELLNESVEQLKSARYCIEDGDCALEAGPDWMFDIQEMIEEKLQKYEEGENE